MFIFFNLHSRDVSFFLNLIVLNMFLDFKSYKKKKKFVTNESHKSKRKKKKEKRKKKKELFRKIEK